MVEQIFLSHKRNETSLLVISWYTRVKSRVVEGLKTYGLSKFGNIRKISKLRKIIA